MLEEQFWHGEVQAAQAVPFQKVPDEGWQDVQVVAEVEQFWHGDEHAKQAPPLRYLVAGHVTQLVGRDPEQDRQLASQGEHTVPSRNSVPRQSLHVPLSSPLPG